MNNNENVNWREIVSGVSSYERMLGNFCNANHITKSPLGKARAYAQKLLPYMRIFLTNGCLEIDNNVAEKYLLYLFEVLASSEIKERGMNDIKSVSCRSKILLQEYI